MSKRHTAIAKRSRASAKYWERATTLLAQREQLMAEITHARQAAEKLGAAGKKAASLLTRYWAGANWDAREDLLRAARWLVSVGNLQLVMAASKAGSPKGTAPAPKRRTTRVVKTRKLAKARGSASS